MFQRDKEKKKESINGEKMSWSIREFLSKSENAFFVEIAREWITDR